MAVQRRALIGPRRKGVSPGPPGPSPCAPPSARSPARDAAPGLNVSVSHGRGAVRPIAALSSGKRGSGSTGHPCTYAFCLSASPVLWTWAFFPVYRCGNRGQIQVTSKSSVKDGLELKCHLSTPLSKRVPLGFFFFFPNWTKVFKARRRSRGKERNLQIP